MIMIPNGMDKIAQLSYITNTQIFKHIWEYLISCTVTDSLRMIGIENAVSLHLSQYIGFCSPNRRGVFICASDLSVHND